MSTKVAPTRRTNKAPTKRRASAPPIRPVKVVKHTEADVHRAVERSIDVLRYHHSQDTTRHVVVAWALLRLLNTRRPDVITDHPHLAWSFVGKCPHFMMLTALAAGTFDRKVCGNDVPLLEWLGCVQRTSAVEALHRIWSPFTVPVEFDFLGVVYMALLGQ